MINNSEEYLIRYAVFGIRHCQIHKHECKNKSLKRFIEKKLSLFYLEHANHGPGDNPIKASMSLNDKKCFHLYRSTYFSLQSKLK